MTLRTSPEQSFLSSQVFFAASVVTSIRRSPNGIAKRMMAAGVKPRQDLTSQLVEGAFIAFLQFLEFETFTLLVLFPNVNLSGGILISLLLILVELAGTSFGLLLSVFSDSYVASITINIGFDFSQILISGENHRKTKTISFLSFRISGAIWPCEAQPEIMQTFAQLFPFKSTLLASANLMVNGSTFTDWRNLAAFFSLTLWILLPLALAYLFVGRRWNVK
jgi:hypothetical protein